MNDLEKSKPAVRSYPPLSTRRRTKQPPDLSPTSYTASKTCTNCPHKTTNSPSTNRPPATIRWAVSLLNGATKRHGWYCKRWYLGAVNATEVPPPAIIPKIQYVVTYKTK